MYSPQQEILNLLRLTGELLEMFAREKTAMGEEADAKAAIACKLRLEEILFQFDQRIRKTDVEKTSSSLEALLEKLGE